MGGLSGLRCVCHGLCRYGVAPHPVGLEACGGGLGAAVALPCLLQRHDRQGPGGADLGRGRGGVGDKRLLSVQHTPVLLRAHLRLREGGRVRGAGHPEPPRLGIVPCAGGVRLHHGPLCMCKIRRAAGVGGGGLCIGQAMPGVGGSPGVLCHPGLDGPVAGRSLGCAERRQPGNSLRMRDRSVLCGALGCLGGRMGLCHSLRSRGVRCRDLGVAELGQRLFVLFDLRR